MSAFAGNFSLMASTIRAGHLGTSRCIPLVLKRTDSSGETESILDLTLHAPYSHRENEADASFYRLIDELQAALTEIKEHHRSKDNAEASAEV